MSATLDDSGGNLLAKPLVTVGSNGAVVNSRRTTTFKQPFKTGSWESVAATAPTSLTTASVLPLRLSLPCRDAEEERRSNAGSVQATGRAADDAQSGGALSNKAGAEAPVQDGSASKPVKRTADAAAAGEAESDSFDELTFAARVQPVKAVTEPAATQPEPAEAAVPTGKRVAAPASASTGAFSVASSLSANAADAGPAAASSSTASTLFTTGAIAAFRQNEQISAPPEIPAAAPSHPVEAVAPVVPKVAAAPLKDISLEVGTADAPKVEIRMVQQSGELQVAVRTGDSDLSHGLQQGLPDLVGRLQENGFRAEAWRPGGTDSHPAAVLETKSSAQSSQSGGSDTGHSGTRQESGQRQQNPSHRPAWVDELEARIHNQNSTGEFYGIGN
jgi:hypothetical protein